MHVAKWTENEAQLLYTQLCTTHMYPMNPCSFCLSAPNLKHFAFSHCVSLLRLKIRHKIQFCIMYHRMHHLCNSRFSVRFVF